MAPRLHTLARKRRPAHDMRMIPVAPSVQRPKRFFCTLDGIRGLAAILVAMSHTLPFLRPATLDEAHLAVDIFFLLSGVVLANAYEERLLSGLGGWHFAMIRAIRLYPLYAFGCLITVISALAGIRADLPPEDLLLSIALAVFLLPNPFMGNDHIFPLNGPSWTLFFEMLANIYYAVFIHSLTTRHLATIMVVSALGLALGLYLR